jgi:hypothetical protein
MSKRKKKEQKKVKKQGLDLTSRMPRPKPIKSIRSSEIITKAQEYPFLGCWIMKGWKETGITPVVVARKQPDDRVVYAVFMVDFYCLGVKDALWKSDVSNKQFHRLLPGLCSNEPVPCEVSLAHELIYGAVEYARKYGFEPDRSFENASLVLDPPGVHKRMHNLEFGKDGKPLFISGLYDNARAIVDKLAKTAGEGNFDYIVFFDEPEDR